MAQIPLKTVGPGQFRSKCSYDRRRLKAPQRLHKSSFRTICFGKQC